jgi:hypothetical protein
LKPSLLAFKAQVLFFTEECCDIMKIYYEKLLTLAGVCYVGRILCGDKTEHLKDNEEMTISP